MARDEFNIDEAEDFDDGTRAVLHTEGSDSDGGNEAQDATRLRSSRKQRLQAERQGGKQREQASALRVKNWDAGLMESAEYAGKVVTRKDLQEDEAMDSPDEDAMADWSDAEPFGASDEEDKAEEEEESEEEDSDDEDKSAEMLIRGFQKEDSARLMGAQDSKKVVEKAKHVRHQKLLWERCLEVQIYTKRLLTSAKDAAAHETDGETTDEEAATKTKQQVVQELYKSIEAVSALQEKLCNVPELTAPSADSPRRSASARATSCGRRSRPAAARCCRSTTTFSTHTRARPTWRRVARTARRRSSRR